MRTTIIAVMMLLTGCVSQSQSPGSANGNFDMREAARTRISLGLTYLQNGNYSQAKMNLDKALEFAPRMADTHYSLAYYYQLVEENERAAEAYNNAMKLAPRNADIANSYGAFLCQINRFEEAQSYFLKAVNSQQYASSAQTYENMALCAQKQGDLNQAIEHVQTALNHQPARAKSLFLLAQLYTANEQFEEAAQTLRRYEKVASISPESLNLAIQIARGRGDMATARGFGDMLISLYPDSPISIAYQKELIENQPAAAMILRKQKATAKESVPTAPASEEIANAQSDVSKPPIDESANTTVAKTDTATSGDNPGNDPQDTQTPRTHVVQSTENLYRISLKYNIRMSSLQEWNNLSDPGSIVTGMTLWLVPPQQQNN